jgi:hypothetical protein
LKHTHLQVAILALTCSSFSGLPGACLAQTGYVIKQSSKFNGPQTISFTDGAVKIFEENSSITYLCRKPAWRWQVYNQRTSKYYECQPEAFIGTAGQRVVVFLHEKLLSGSFRKVSSAKVMNEPVERFVSPLSSGTTESGKPVFHNRYIEVSMLAHDQLPKTVREAVCRVYGLPLGGVPIDATYLDDADSKRKALLTIRLDKKTLGQEFFTAPKNCIKVKSEREVFVDEVRDSDVNQLLGGH